MRREMLGAIAGDIFGAVYEGNPLKLESFDLFEVPRFFTDDTVLTVATADAILTGGDYGAAYPRSSPMAKKHSGR
jgi:ADP-ribosylglycohydrolase